MHTSAAPVVEVPGRTRRDFRAFLTGQLRPVLEHTSVRISVVGLLLVAASGFNLIPHPVGLDSGWIYIVPVAISAIAGGLQEGLLVALAASVLGSFFSGAGLDDFDLALVLETVPASFALFGLTAAFLGAFADAHHSVQSNYRQLAEIDPLTKVANITTFYSRLEALDSETTPYAMLLCDLDDLKGLNDTFGHQAGSEAIQTLADVLRRVVRSSDCLARFGGDEFVLTLRDADRPAAETVVQRVREMMSAEVLEKAPGHHITVSIGVAVYGEDGTTAAELLTAADQAMYTNKRFHKGLLATRLDLR